MHNKFITVKTKAFGKEFVHPDNNGKLLSNTQILTSSKYINASKDKEFADMIRKDKMTGMYINEYDAIIISDAPASKNDIAAAKHWGRPVKDELNTKRQTSLVHKIVHKIIRGRPEEIFSKQLNTTEIQNGINIEKASNNNPKWSSKKFNAWKRPEIARAKERGLNVNDYVCEELIAYKTELNPLSTFSTPKYWYEKDIKKEMLTKQTNDRLFKPTKIKIKVQN